ncbi:MoaD/ThiS family protein [Actinomadura barringtoniae]|uniref:MoaD/ThiS family protein n=1 Tax=Actinomadura barringtoniae TaxID=1427535 RepID=A0A939T8Q7_9ACTN|nr:PHB depolymerase family esterase [Actinomadura barringtoniae]MBO2453414.1 MoaD/ThiS family protein [Actinomadura barringtoniae]
MESDGTVISDELTVDGLARGFTIRPPNGPSADGPRPLVLVLHGNHPDEGAGSRMMRELTTFDDQADARGWVVVYPDGHSGNWADGRGVTTAEEAGVDDVAFLSALINHMAAHHGTWPDRTVVAGASNGAFMAHRLALAAGDQVAVLAAVAGTLPVALHEVRPAHAVSALLMHGTADEIAPIGGGYSRHRGPNGELRGRTVSLDATAERWRTIDRCPAPGPDGTRETEFSIRTTAAGGVGGTQVATWQVLGDGHGWPTMREFDAAEEICRFAEPLLLPAAARRL